MRSQGYVCQAAAAAGSASPSGASDAAPAEDAIGANTGRLGRSEQLRVSTGGASCRTRGAMGRVPRVTDMLDQGRAVQRASCREDGACTWLNVNGCSRVAAQQQRRRRRWRRQSQAAVAVLPSAASRTQNT